MTDKTENAVIPEPERAEQSKSSPLLDTVLALGCFFIVAGLSMGGGISGFFEPVALFGVVMTVGFWKHRRGGIRGALAFLGVFVTAYGAIMSVLYWNMQ